MGHQSCLRESSIKPPLRHCSHTSTLTMTQKVVWAPHNAISTKSVFVRVKLGGGGGDGCLKEPSQHVYSNHSAIIPLKKTFSRRPSKFSLRWRRQKECCGGLTVPSGGEQEDDQVHGAFHLLCFFSRVAFIYLFFICYI